MGRKGKRIRIDTGIFRDEGGYSIIAYGKETRAPNGLNTTRAELYRLRADWIEELEKRDPTRGAPAGSLARDIPQYLALSKHFADKGSSQGAHLRAWVPELGTRVRRSITRADILRVRGDWIVAGVKPKTCNNRVSALRALYRTLDGAHVPTPCDHIEPLPTHRTPAVSVSPALILAVDQQLQAFERSGRLRDAKTRARFRVRAATGRRPSEIMRAERQDVDLERRIWTPRDGKGGFTPGIYLTDDMRLAWELFIAADAWGPFSTDSMAEVLHAAGWPTTIRPYNLRHSVGIALSESGVDLADVQQLMGHKDQRTTRAHYVPVLASRLQEASERLEGRLHGWRVPRSGPTPHVEPRGKASKKTARVIRPAFGAQQRKQAGKPQKTGRKRA